MGPKKAKGEASSKKASPASSKTAHGRSSSPAPSSSKTKNKDLPPSAGYLISCDVPTKQYIIYLNQLKNIDKKFIIEDLDSTHLLVKKKARDEISRKVEAWMDENFFSAVERVGEDLDMS